MTDIKSEKHQEARDGLSDDLKPVFDELVEEYRYRTARRYGQPYVSYIVLADLVRVGWRRSAEAIEEE